jgi:hypothetical protein
MLTSSMRDPANHAERCFFDSIGIRFNKSNRDGDMPLGQSMNAQSLNKISALPCAIRTRSVAETGVWSRSARAWAIEP